ncbi:hypothetical protein BDZ90DRAFT_229078 [Jaminaea rosea]|uniref:SAM domain-containing protein n=1 Tax=Jaminaea rosea TaxID=1569628 RepID=A0A316V3M7_9BASI|nr:hypothetical protein BDZ90DRAFT_229078 [Jaminaea rosea]PWN30045.1 hypothetical protein BDZ90DRAFT_229078 [Jaminaea rosea]
MSDNNNNSNSGNGASANNASSLRPPSSATPQTHSMGSAPIGRSSSPLGSNPSRYSLGKPSTPSEQMLRKAHDVGVSGGGAGLRSPSSTFSLGSSAGLARYGPRPSSEMLGMAGGNSVNAEQEAIDKWFEDLQHYEATLEEMAAASLDQNFKEELSAIEQWFRVLSEAERTAALYSLLQESTQVQIRFFITVLQQMARSDPMSALLSPSANNPMAEQMEAKLASLGLKSPTAMKTPSSPGNRATHSYLSPNAASMNFSPGSDAAAALLAAQRAKLKANRVSAPGTFTGDQRGEHQRNSFQGSGLDQVQERGGDSPSINRSRSPGLDAGGRPKSIDVLGASAAKSPRRSGPLDDQLSPVPSSGNWASMVNTPLTNMFDDHQGSNVNLDAASSQLATVAEGQTGGSGIQLDQDMSKYQRRRSGQPGYDQQYGSGGGGGSGHSPNLGSSAWPSNSSASAQQPDFLRASPNPGSAQFSAFQTMSPNTFAGLQSPSGGFGNGMNMQMMNAMAAMGVNNANAAQFLQMQQQILQNQQQIAAMAAAQQQQQHGQRRDRAGGLTTPHTAAMAGRRSPAANNNRPLAPPNSGKGLGSATTATPGSAATAGGGEEEVPDLSVLNDVPAWLRHLRLHKYTPNFESSNWKEMAVMTDSDLEAKGVAALGARRKLLKTFKAVREKHGLMGRDDEEKAGDGLRGAATAAASATGKKEGESTDS